MRFYLLKLTVILILVCGIFNTRPTIAGSHALQIFSGTLTEITCSADLPVFRLVTEEGIQHTNYSQLPSLFDIEAMVSPDKNNVTLLVNGTNCSNNVTVICRDLSNAVTSGEIETLFMLVLEFISTLPPPNNVHHTSQGPGGRIQVMWQPPTLFTPQNINIHSRITHYVVSIISDDTKNISNETTETSFSLELDNVPCNFSFHVAAVNPAGIGEHSHPQNIDWCAGSPSSTVVTVESVPISSGLSAGEIAGIIIVPVLIIAALSVTSIIYIIIKFNCKSDRHQQAIQSLESELSSEISDPKHTSTLPDKHMEPGPSSSDNDGNNIINVDEKHASTQRGRSYSQEGPPTGQLYYSEIDVLAKRKNQIPEVEDAGPHEYAVLEQSHDINIVHPDQTDEVIETEPNEAYNKDHNHHDSGNS